ncbi:sulfatase-like hydrolase/transferase [Candidatus Sumerlaeota bacterium]|nr:sulfatase-like hydrolase/transferase [Candidatus Sumerlaeota bacterium]
MKRFCLLAAILLGLRVFPAAAENPQSSDAPTSGSSTFPNIVFIRTDDQGAWAVGALGNRDIRTPNMDRIHREGAVCVNSFVTTPVCSPSRAGMLTGIYGVQAGVTEYLEHKDTTTGLATEFVTWPEALQQMGYVTGLIGKWHLGNDPKFHPLKHGYDYFMGIVGGGTISRGPKLEINGVTREVKGVYTSDFLTDDALHFLRQNKDIPFLLQLDFRSPHWPYNPESRDDTAPYVGGGLRIPEAPDLDREYCGLLTARYYASISAVDRNIGRILSALDKLGIEKNTILVFTSDNGYMIGQHGLLHKGNGVLLTYAGREMEDSMRRRPNMFEESIRVPLAIRWPGKIKPGTVIHKMIQQIDLYQTLLALAGVRMPELPPSQPMQGRDFSPFLLGTAAADAPWREEIFCDYDMKEGKKARMRMIRTTHWKLIKHYEEENGADELYDLDADPAESRNLFAAPPDGGVLDDLERRLARWQKSIHDPLLESDEFKKRQAKYLDGD